MQKKTGRLSPSLNLCDSILVPLRFLSEFRKPFRDFGAFAVTGNTDNDSETLHLLGFIDSKSVSCKVASHLIYHGFNLIRLEIIFSQNTFHLGIRIGRVVFSDFKAILVNPVFISILFLFVSTKVRKKNDIYKCLLDFFLKNYAI